VRGTNLIIFINRRSRATAEVEERKKVVAEVKVGARRERKRGRRSGEGNTTVEGCRCGRVKYPSDGQFSGRAWEKEGKSRERREMNIGCSTRAKKRERERRNELFAH